MMMCSRNHGRCNAMLKCFGACWWRDGGDNDKVKRGAGPHLRLGGQKQITRRDPAADWLNQGALCIPPIGLDCGDLVDTVRPSARAFERSPSLDQPTETATGCCLVPWGVLCEEKLQQVQRSY